MSLATKYRPKKFMDIVEQDTIKAILQNQINSGQIKNCYLFCGPASCGKTTSARIFAKEINNNSGVITELDAASHSGVDDVRKLIEDSRFKPIGQKYKTFLIDECHALSNAAWQAFLLSLEEPVPTSIFIFCTTDPQKIPATIISRIQRYDFQKITQAEIEKRLKYIVSQENSEGNNYTYDDEAISYIAKLSEGGMRDSITLLEKVLCYNSHVSMEAVVDALGTVPYATMFDLTDALCKMDKKATISIVENIHTSGMDLKQFIKNYNTFVIDLCKFDLFGSFEYLQIPSVFSDRMNKYSAADFEFFITLLNEVITKANY